jgi:hypothetical protein
MLLKAHTRRIPLLATLLLLVFSFLFTGPVTALASTSRVTTLSGLTGFPGAMQHDESNTLRKVDVAGVLALPVIQQPPGDTGYVSPLDGEVTQFGMAAHFGNIGLLAHNHLSGRLFSQLAIGQEVRLEYGNGRTERYLITQIMQFEALEPTSPYSAFRDLDTAEILSAEKLFRKVYGGDRHVTFQTCIAGPGSLSWGRLFVIAVPKIQSAGAMAHVQKRGWE